MRGKQSKQAERRKVELLEAEVGSLTTALAEARATATTLRRQRESEATLRVEVERLREQNEEGASDGLEALAAHCLALEGKLDRADGYVKLVRKNYEKVIAGAVTFYGGGEQGLDRLAQLLGDAAGISFHVHHRGQLPENVVRVLERKRRARAAARSR